jgi:hypothetical protein
MMRMRMALMLGSAFLVLGCEAKIGEGEGNAASNDSASAEGKSEEGQIALSMPGFDVKMNVPLDKAETDDQGKILYPGSKVTGLYIAAHPDAASGSDGEVELRFATPDPPAKVAAWYRDSARAPDFSLTADGKEGEAYVLAGEQKEDKESFRLRLEADGAGTDGRLVVRDKN